MFDFVYSFNFSLESFECDLGSVAVEYFECARDFVGVVFVVYEVDSALASRSDFFPKV